MECDPPLIRRTAVTSESDEALAVLRAYLDPLGDSVRKRARGGWLLDAAKIVVTIGFFVPVGLVVLIVLAIMSGGHVDGVGSALKLLWRSIEPERANIEGAKSALSHLAVGSGTERAARCASLYAVLERLESQHRPTHTTLARIAGQLDVHRADLDASPVGAAPSAVPDIAPSG